MHQNGFLTNGGSNFVIRHNSFYCVGGCTSDIGFIPDDNISNATADKYLLVATEDAAFCLYPSSDHPRKPGILSGMVVTVSLPARPQWKVCLLRRLTLNTPQQARYRRLRQMFGLAICGITVSRSAHHDVTGNWLS